MNIKKIALALIAVAAVSLALTACMGSDENSDSQGSSQGADYAVILKTLSDDFWVQMKKGAEDEAAKLGVKVDVFAAQDISDSAGQLTILENCLGKGYKAIAVTPVSPTNLINGIVHANEKGIYVMNIDEKVDLETLRNAGGSLIGFATTDNTAVGEKAADFIIESLGESGGKVAIIEGKAGNATGESRKNGAKSAFEKAEGIELVAVQPADWDRQKAVDTATSFIQMHSDLKAIYCCNDTMALGALQAVINANKLGEILVVGTDGTAEAIQSVEEGKLSATVAQNAAEIGAAAVRQMVEAVKEQPEIDPASEPPMIPIDSELVTK